MIDFIKKWGGERSGLRALRFVDWLGISRSKYYDWRERYGKANEHNRLIPRDHWLQAWERRAIIDFHHEFPLEGLIAGFVEHYNTMRLHSAIGYITPQDKLLGKDKAIFAARDQKLAWVRLQRKINRQNQPAHSVTHTTVFSN